MGRWEPDARGRLDAAALDLYLEHGFDHVTVAQIAERAGLTERTFFRYYADKREVLFAGAAALQGFLVDAVLAAPAAAEPIAVVGAALETAAAEWFEPVRDHSRRRSLVIAANTALQERELIKLATLSRALAEALRQRGVPDAAATLAAEAGVVVFRFAFERWADGPGQPPLADLIRASMDELAALTASVR